MDYNQGGTRIMNMSEQVIQVLDNLCQKFGVVVDWSAENVIPYLQNLGGRIITYEIWTSVAEISITLIICAIFWIVYGATYKKAAEEDWDEDYVISWVNCIALIFSIITTVITICIICNQTFDIIEAIHLPEKTIYDMITRMINK